jgi:DNA-binding transcriptional MocR family regulator
VELAYAHELLVLSDDVYGLLHFTPGAGSHAHCTRLCYRCSSSLLRLQSAAAAVCGCVDSGSTLISRPGCHGDFAPPEGDARRPPPRLVSYDHGEGRVLGSNSFTKVLVGVAVSS